jgi:1,4-alpha-glucan branching enzyme
MENNLILGAGFMSKLENNSENLIVEEVVETKELAQKKNGEKKKPSRARTSKTEGVSKNVDPNTEVASDDDKVTKKVSKTKRSTKKKDDNLEVTAQKSKGDNEKKAKKTTKKTEKAKGTVAEKVVKPTRSRAKSKIAESAVGLVEEIKNVDKDDISQKEIINHKNKVNDFISDFNIYLFHEGSHYDSYKFMGAHLVKEDGVDGVRFTTWAPNATSVNVTGDFSSWQIKSENELERVSDAGLWSGFIPNIGEATVYKFAVKSKESGKVILKSDPYAVRSELRPNTASMVTAHSEYSWKDSNWLESRSKTNVYQSPINIYEVHLGSWKRKEDGSFYSYSELADILPSYVSEQGYTHVELMPVMEHPLDDSWGYQITGYYSVTSRYGSPDDFRILVDAFHKANIGVILDWVPGHFCKDLHGLYMFDGTPTYEYKEDWKQENKGWGAANFDLGKSEVRSFLISNAIYWIKEFHVDGLRVDAVANMLYLDYDRRSGEWRPNKYGGHENLEAIEFLRCLNRAIFKEENNVLVIAEESTSWPMVTKPGEIGGLGFNFKWNMGWMNDMLRYIKIDPIYRKYHHNLITFSMMYNYSENFILPISHDEVVHGKKSLLDKMWGDYWNKFAGLRLFISYMLAHPGKKLLFMGSEFGQFIEWRNHEGLEFELAEKFDMHRDTKQFFKDINRFYIENEALWKFDYDTKGFEWIDANNSTQSIIVFMRKTDNPLDTLIYVCNFTSVVYYDFNIGVPYLGDYKQVFNTDGKEYGGSGQIIDEVLFSEKSSWHNQKYKLKIKVPPMATLILKPINIINDIEETYEEVSTEVLNCDKAIDVSGEKL